MCAVHWQSVINSFRGTGCTCADCTSMCLRVHGASVCVITDSRALSRKSSTVTILEKFDLTFLDPEEHKELLSTPKDFVLLYLMVKIKEKKKFPNFLATFVRSTNDALTCLLGLTFFKIESSFQRAQSVDLKQPGIPVFLTILMRTQN